MNYRVHWYWDILRTFSYQSRTISPRIPRRTTLGKPYANLALTKQTRTSARWPRGHFQIGDVIRTWRISQNSLGVSHENLDVEYYRFDYQFYKRIHLVNILVVSSRNRSNSPLRSRVTAGEEVEENETGSFEARLYLSGICSLAFKVSL